MWETGMMPMAWGVCIQTDQLGELSLAKSVGIAFVRMIFKDRLGFSSLLRSGIRGLRRRILVTEEILHCAKCRKTPSELNEYQSDMTGEDIQPDDYVWENEGTLNKDLGLFWCTKCYIEIGMPLGVAP